MSLTEKDLASEVLVDRFRAKQRVLPGSDCLWWAGAISRNAGHGRFWLGTGRVVVAHRFAFALAEGLDALTGRKLSSQVRRLKPSEVAG